MAQKLDAKGGEKGDLWDDGVHENVRKVCVGQGQDCISFIKFEYVDGSQVVVGDEHGKHTFEVDADDYIIYVEAFCEKKTEETIVALKFATYKGKTNQEFQTSPGVKYVLQGGKIVGFHGRSSDVLHSLGAYVSFPSTPELLGKWAKCATPGESLSARGGAGLEVVEGKVWVVYGFDGCEVDDVHYYDPVEDKWTQVETYGEKPCARSVFASAVVGKHIVIFGGEIAMDPQAHVGPGQMTGGTFALNTETLKWERLDKLGEDEETPNVRAWSASTSGTIDGKKGLVMFGGKAQTNARFDDLFFYGIDSA
ncbi:unnamed protein product [Eruca vesicaria subsp. sativa]|uniref:Jacalin-type lectin domain-containing protein n=1 Tax=Eruca vesicaria subsp. sativa TaxID=29727 RepID=A0ABC8KVR5_ERUVS|nr:unnamed protein product [Eruca vesicaria subsp. sativa]